MTYPTAEQHSIRAAAGVLRSDQVAGRDDRVAFRHNGWLPAPTEDALRDEVAGMATIIQLRDDALAAVRQFPAPHPRHQEYVAEWRAYKLTIAAISSLVRLFLGVDALAIIMRDAEQMANAAPPFPPHEEDQP